MTAEKSPSAKTPDTDVPEYLHYLRNLTNVGEPFSPAVEQVLRANRQLATYNLLQPVDQCRMVMNAATELDMRGSGQGFMVGLPQSASDALRDIAERTTKFAEIKNYLASQKSLVDGPDTTMSLQRINAGLDVLMMQPNARDMRTVSAGMAAFSEGVGQRMERNPYPNPELGDAAIRIANAQAANIAQSHASAIRMQQRMESATARSRA